MEDLLRAIAYFVLGVWAVLFLVFPSEPYVSALDTATRYFWMITCASGALAATGGALFRIDLKVELPGLIFMLIGPLFYFTAQIFYSFNPPEGMIPSARYALAFYALLPIFLTLPRIYHLCAEARRVKVILATTKFELTPEQEAQPGAFNFKLKDGE